MVERVLLKKGISYYCTFSFTEQNLPNNGKKRAEKLKFLIKKANRWSQSVHGFEIGPKSL